MPRNPSVANTNTGAFTEGTIKIHAPSAEGLTCTVEYPNGRLREWKQETVRRRGFEVPAVARQTFELRDARTGRVDPNFVLVYGRDLKVGDRVQGEDNAVTSVSVSGRNVEFRLGRFRRTTSTYTLVAVAKS